MILTKRSYLAVHSRDGTYHALMEVQPNEPLRRALRDIQQDYDVNLTGVNVIYDAMRPRFVRRIYLTPYQFYGVRVTGVLPPKTETQSILDFITN